MTHVCPRCDAVTSHLDHLGLCQRCHAEVVGTVPEALDNADRVAQAELARPRQRPLPTIGDEYDDHPLVGAAIRSIWAFAPRAEHTIAREQAEAVLRWWQRYGELSAPEVEAVLRRFATTAELRAHGNSGPGGPLREVDEDE